MMLTTASLPRPARVKPALYGRALVALATIAAWSVAVVGGVVLWSAPRGRGLGDAEVVAGIARGALLDVHVAASFLAVGLTIAHLAFMRRGVIAYLRLLTTGQRRAGPAGRPVARIVIVRALLVAGLLTVVTVVAITGVIPWLGPDGRRSGQQVLALLLTKRSWLDVHLVAGLLVAAIAIGHNLVVRHGLVADLWLLATGQRRVPRRRAVTGSRSGVVTGSRSGVVTAGSPGPR
jgi:hypothetical protein